MQAANDKQRYLEDFRRFRAERDPEWMRPIRRAAIARFEEIGFPSSREEEWRYTNVARVVGTSFRPAFESDVVDSTPTGIERFSTAESTHLVFLNGRLLASASRLDTSRGVHVRSLAQALAGGDDVVARHLTRHASFDRNGFTALSTAFLEDGALVSLADGAAADRPIELVFLASAAKGDVVAHPRVLVRCGRESRATIVESYVSLGDGATLTNAVAEVVLAEGAELRHVRVASEGERASHVATTQVAQGRDSRYRALSVVFGEAFLRHNLGVRCEAEGAECSLDGLYVAGGRGFIDNHTEIDHAAPHTTSRELYKGVLGGHAKAVFNGKVIVRPDAQKTDAQQTNKNLLVSAHAEIDTKPELQISADDVKCSHGAAIGQLDPQALFYLKSRGIGDAKGRRLLVHAFANEMIERFGESEVAPHLARALDERILRYVHPDFVHVLVDGRIVRTGGRELAAELESKGYDFVREALYAGRA